MSEINDLMAKVAALEYSCKILQDKIEEISDRERKLVEAARELFQWQGGPLGSRYNKLLAALQPYEKE